MKKLLIMIAILVISITGFSQETVKEEVKTQEQVQTPIRKRDGTGPQIKSENQTEKPVYQCDGTQRQIRKQQNKQQNLQRRSNRRVNNNRSRRGR